MPEIDAAEELVRQDVEQGIGGWLNSAADVDLAGFRVLEPFVGDPISNAETGTVAVPWAWVGRHEGEVMGYLPTGNVVEVRGISVVRDTDDGPAFSRFVDWVGVLAQIGVSFTTRPIEFVDPPDV